MYWRATKPCLNHRIQSQRSWICEGEPKWTVRRLSRRKQIHLCLPEHPPYFLHHLRVETPLPGSQPLALQDVLAPWDLGPWDLGGNSLNIRKTAIISTQLMCLERWCPLHRPWVEWSSRIASQPVKEASVISSLRWQYSHDSLFPWDRNQCFFHITKAHKHHHFTLIMQKGFPLGENLLVWWL